MLLNHLKTKLSCVDHQFHTSLIFVMKLGHMKSLYFSVKSLSLGDQNLLKMVSGDSLKLGN